MPLNKTPKSFWPIFSIYFCLILSFVYLMAFFYLRHKGIDSKASLFMAFYMGLCGILRMRAIGRDDVDKKDKGG